MANPSKKQIEVRQASSDTDFNHVFDIRTQVFVEEQHISQEDEYDGFDHLANHYLAFCEGEPAGASRWRMTQAGRIRMERFAVKDAFRGVGIGKALLQKMMEDVPEEREIFLHAQIAMIPYYEKLGFLAEGEVFEEAGLEHRLMVLKR